MSVISKGEREELLKLFDGLRVADVRDGMDWCGMHLYGSMTPAMRPLYRTHIIGIAKTARYLPFQGPVPKLTPDEYTEWQGWYYNTVCTYNWEAGIEEGDIMVIEATGLDAGLIGSNNGLGCKRKGLRGFVTSGAVRDTDEMILTEIPAWSMQISQAMVQARMQYEAMDVPVSVGGVRVEPGDVVVADGDGVIVVPRKIARDVAKYARKELDNDKVNRRAHYEALGMDLDDTVK